MKAATPDIYGKSVNPIFQSTPPVKAATQPSRADQLAELISIHAAREGGDVAKGMFTGSQQISIHAAREGGDVAIMSAILLA